MTSTDGIESIDEVVARLEKVLSALPEADANRHFLATYLRTTVAVGEAVSSGAFSDPEWVQRWDVAFAHLYLDAIEAYLDGSPTPAPWTVAFGTASERPEMAPLRHVLLGINAHINFDLPQALLAVMSDDDFAHPEVVAARQRDHDAIGDS